jgi:uncharacterized protein (UPF0332 family)
MEEVQLHLEEADSCLAEAELLLASSHLRQESDYRLAGRLTNEKAQEVLGWAKEFVEACRKVCE